MTVGGDSSGAPAKPPDPVGTPPEVLSKPTSSRSVPEAGPASSFSVPAEGPASSHSVPDAEQNLAGGFDAVNSEAVVEASSQRLLPDGAQELPEEALRKRRLTLAFRQPEVTVTSEWDQYAACVESAILAGLDVSAAYDFSDGKNADVCEPSLSERGKV